MGWDAYACTPGWLIDDPEGNGDRLDDSNRQAFRKADDELIKIVGGGNAYLRDGELGKNSARLYLSRATPIACYDETIADGQLYWPVEMVLKAHSLAGWNFRPEDVESFLPSVNAYWAARI